MPPIKPRLEPFCFNSYGVNIEIHSNDRDVLASAAETVRIGLLGNLGKSKPGSPAVRFDLVVSPKGMVKLLQDGERLSTSPAGWKFDKFFDGIVGAAVGANAPGLVFLHAGVVGWKGKAIVMPANSFDGKSTLTTALVRQGAEYYSDDFAIIDGQGLVRPFARTISMRTDEKKMKLYDIKPNKIGRVGRKPIPVSTLVFTRYRRTGKWRPQEITPGQAVLKMVPHTLPIRVNPEFSMRVLNNLAQRAILISSTRGEADIFAQNLLNYVDKHVV